jgi:hypothetical protein
MKGSKYWEENLDVCWAKGLINRVVKNFLIILEVIIILAKLTDLPTCLPQQAVKEGGFKSYINLKGL